MAVRCLNDAHGENWHAYHGDCVDVVAQLPDRSVDLSVYSPPFSGLYIYNDSEADMGNSADDAEFMRHYSFLVKELFRVTRPGRLCYVHCKDLVFYRSQTGHDAGLRDFQGMLITAHQAAGWTLHARITIPRSPVREMTKTKAHRLLYKQLRADSTFSGTGLPEYFLVFRRWAREGEEVIPVPHTAEEFPLSQWQEWAEAVWPDTRETDVLNAIRAAGDEKHICPLPLDLIKRAVIMGSNPGEVILSPFMGIGSEGYQALKEGRRFVGVELKREYWEQACRHLGNVEANAPSFFPLLGEEQAA